MIGLWITPLLEWLGLGLIPVLLIIIIVCLIRG